MESVPCQIYRPDGSACPIVNCSKTTKVSELLGEFQGMLLFTGQPGADHMTPILNWNMTLVDLNMWFEKYTAELSLYRPEETHRYRRDLYDLYSGVATEQAAAAAVAAAAAADGSRAAKRARMDR